MVICAPEESSRYHSQLNFNHGQNDTEASSAEELRSSEQNFVPQVENPNHKKWVCSVRVDPAAVNVGRGGRDRHLRLMAQFVSVTAETEGSRGFVIGSVETLIQCGRLSTGAMLVALNLGFDRIRGWSNDGTYPKSSSKMAIGLTWFRAM